MTGNDYSHMIRGHDQCHPEHGYRFHFDNNRCITVSSDSATPMMVYIDPGKKLGVKELNDVPPTIRLVQLDPTTTSTTGGGGGGGGGGANDAAASKQDNK